MSESSTGWPPPMPGSPYGVPARPGTGMAIASLVLGIIGLVGCFPLGLVGLILGIIALARTGSEPTRYGGSGLAVGGIVTGALSLIIVPLLLSIVLPSFSRARELAKRAVDAANLREVGQSVRIYANGHQDAFPPDLQTLVSAGTIAEEQLINPSSGHTPPACDYYYVVGLTENAPPNWIVAYSDAKFHGGEGANILYVDGHVEFVKEPKFTADVRAFLAAFEKAHGAPPSVIPPK